MRYFYDCEFIEDGRTIDLISIGIVAEDGRKLYLVNDAIVDEPLYDRIRGHNWLMANVVPHLPLAKRHDGTPWIYEPGSPNVFPRKLGSFNLDPHDNSIVSRRFMRNAVRDFLLGGKGKPELWADYGAYDHVALCQLFGAMVDLPEGLPMWTHDFQHLLKAEAIGADTALPKQADCHHNALADARHLKACWDYGFKAGWWS